MSLQNTSPLAKAAAEFVEQLKCPDCELPYKDCGAAIFLSNDDWKQVYPEGQGQPGTLCPTCICRRIEKLDGNKTLVARLKG